MRELILNKNKITLVDDDIYELYSQYQWNAELDRTTGYYYATRKFYVGHWRDGKRYKARLHRLVIGAEKGQMVDHINRDTLDNRRENLRIVTNSQNRMNIVRKTVGTSKYKGVYWSKQYKKFIAQARKDGKLYRLGMFDSEVEAAICYNQNVVNLFGEFARLNEIV